MEKLSIIKCAVAITLFSFTVRKIYILKKTKENK